MRQRRRFKQFQTSLRKFNGDIESTETNIADIQRNMPEKISSRGSVQITSIPTGDEVFVQQSVGLYKTLINLEGMKTRVSPTYRQRSPTTKKEGRIKSKQESAGI
jgi:hypothetical protein